MSSKRMFRRAGFFCLSVGLAFAAEARKPFELDFSVNNGADTLNDVGFTTVAEAIEEIDLDRLGDRLNYNPDGSQVLVNMDFRGLGMTMEFAASAGTLVFEVPGLQINEQFVGRGEGVRAQRADALDQLETYLEQNPDALKRILTRLAQVSPIDPLAGNPLSLMSQTQGRNFAHGFTHKVSQVYGCSTTAFNRHGDVQLAARDEGWALGCGIPVMVARAGDGGDLFREAQDRAAALRGENEIGIGLSYQSTTADVAGGSYKSSSVNLPLSYTAKFNADPRKKFRIDIPLSYTDAEGAKSYSVGLGFAYTHPISDVWTLTPAVGAGVTGSEDLGSAGGVVSYSIASAYSWRIGDWGLSMGNMVGKYDSLGLTLGDIEAEADISSTAFVNGLLLSGPGSLLARDMVIEYHITDTRLTGDEVYAEYYDEAGVSVGWIKQRHGVITRYLKAGVSYLTGDRDISGYKLNLALRF